MGDYELECGYLLGRRDHNNNGMLTYMCVV